MILILIFDLMTIFIGLSVTLTPCFIRPPDTVVGGLRFYRDSSIFFFYLFRHLPSELVERNSTKPGQDVSAI